MNPFLHHGIVQVGGRLEKAPLSFIAGHPTMLRHVSRITQSIVDHYYLEIGHGGANFTLNFLQELWTIKPMKWFARRQRTACIVAA